VKEGDKIMNTEIKKALDEKIEELNTRNYSQEQYNHYLQGLLVGLRMTDAITQEERYSILDVYSKPNQPDYKTILEEVMDMMKSDLQHLKNSDTKLYVKNVISEIEESIN
jgi:hypothetical protein